MEESNNWSNRPDIADELIRPDLGHGKRTDEDREAELETIAAALGGAWTRDRPYLTRDVVALLDALARVV